jgi:hypothetical protein
MTTSEREGENVPRAEQIVLAMRTRMRGEVLVLFMQIHCLTVWPVAAPRSRTGPRWEEE